ncbi:MAG: glycosyltransferase family 2 protein [bacterium]
MLSVSVNLVTYNGRRFIENCLKSVLRQTYPKVEILIIDNASQDNTVLMAQEIIGKENPKFPVRIIKNEKNLGFSAGHNLGIKESRGELVVCLNQDVVLVPDFIEKAVEFFEKNGQTEIAALQPKLLRLDKELQPSSIIDTTGLVMLKNRRIISRGQGQKDEGQYGNIEEVFGADGAAPVYKRDALEDVKINVKCQMSNVKTADGEYFDEDFFAYKEDVDLSWRLRLAGWKIFYVPKVIAWHGRSAGDSTATNYFAIIRERLKISKFAKYVAFKNQRLMQIKNEQLFLLLKHLPRFLVKEISSWTYVILFERFTWSAIRDLFRQAPRAFQKRKIIMESRRASVNEMGKWFI